MSGQTATELTTPTHDLTPEGAAFLDSIQEGDYPRCSACPPDRGILPTLHYYRTSMSAAVCGAVLSSSWKTSNYTTDRDLVGCPMCLELMGRQAAPSPAIQAVESRAGLTPNPRALVWLIGTLTMKASESRQNAAIRWGPDRNHLEGMAEAYHMAAKWLAMAVNGQIDGTEIL